METGYLLILVAALFVSLKLIVQKHILKKEHAEEEMVTESIFQVLVLTVLIPFITVPSWPIMAVIYINALFLTSTTFVGNKAYRKMPISSIAPMKNLSPIILLIIAFLTLNERPTISQLGGVALIALGGFGLQLQSWSFAEPFRKLREEGTGKLVLKLLVLMSILATVQKYTFQTQEISILTYMFWMHLFFALNNTALNYYRHRLENVASDMQRDWPWLLAVALLGSADLAIWYSVIAQPAILISLAIPLRRVSTLIETVLGGSLFHEEDLWKKAAACAVMIIGVFIMM